MGWGRVKLAGGFSLPGGKLLWVAIQADGLATLNYPGLARFLCVMGQSLEPGKRVGEDQFYWRGAVLSGGYRKRSV
jgi:hypothetical protein